MQRYKGRGEYTATAVEAGAAMEVEAAARVCEIDPLVNYIGCCKCLVNAAIERVI